MVVLHLCVLVVGGGLAAAGEAPEAENPQTTTVALRPKVGGLYAFEGDIGDMFDGMFQAEVGVKGTFEHFGLEFSLGTFRDDRGETSFIPMPADPEDPPLPERMAEIDAQMTMIRITGTFELNPLAGVKGHEKQGNAYFGVGAGYYPTRLKVSEAVPPLELMGGTNKYDGFGPHAVLGAEYFFNRVFGVFTEVQYTYLYMKSKGNADSLDMHGVSGLAGFTLKF
jgi:hypothetical protein